MTRPKGVKNKKPYPMTPAAHTQRVNAWVKALEAMPVSKPGEKKKGSNKEKITDGYAHIKSLQKLTDCTHCSAKLVCPKYEELAEETESKNRTKCPLWNVYRSAIINVTQQPLMYLAKKAADLDIAIAQQKMIDAEQGKPLSKIMLTATKVALEAVKIAQNAEKHLRKGRRIVGERNEDIVLDVNFDLKE